MDQEYPYVSVVIPVKNSQRTIGATLESLEHQNYPGHFQVILVGNTFDKTWGAIAGHNVRAIKVGERLNRGRDANIKRSRGMHNAQGEIIAVTDGDTVLPPHWLSTGVQAIAHGGWHCVGGGVESTTDTFWSRYMDGTVLAPKNLRVRAPYIITAETFGIGVNKPPTTANAFVTRAAYEAAGGPDPTMHWSYEDYEWFWRIADAGFSIRFLPELECGHDHQKRLPDFFREYWRGGLGCGDFIARHPGSRFAIRRQRQAKVALATTATLIVLAGVLAALSTIGLLVLIASGASTYMVASAIEFSRNRRFEVVAYPALTFVLSLTFALGTLRESPQVTVLEEPVVTPTPQSA